MGTEPKKPEPLVFELRYRREAWEIAAGVYKRLEKRDAQLPETPAMYTPLRGSHGAVAAQADFNNKLQTKHGFLDFFFFPEVAETEPANGGSK